MDSKIAKAIALEYQPVAIILTDEKPANALQFKEGRWGCVIGMFSGAARGRTVVFDRQTFGCLGGGVGLGFGNMYEHFPGGIECFLSTGNKEFCQTPTGQAMVSSMPALEEGERYFKTPEIAKAFVDALPITDIPFKYIVFKPLNAVTAEETPEIIVFLANPDQISALFVLANYNRPGGQAVATPFGAGCHTIFLIPYNESKKEQPQAIIGMMDISVRKRVDKDKLSFAVPYKMFLEMESHVAESFLSYGTWAKVLERYK